MKKVLTLSLSLVLGLILLLTGLTNISEGILGLNTSFGNTHNLWNTNTSGSFYTPYFFIPSWSPETLRLITSFGNTYHLWNKNDVGYFNDFKYRPFWHNNFNDAFDRFIETIYNPWTGNIQFNIAYTPPNHPPTLDPIGHQIVNEGALLQFSINAEDPEGDDLTYSVSNLPIGASFDPAFCIFTWKPDFTQAGDYQDICFTVSDNGTTSKKGSEIITITVIDVGYGPWSMRGHDAHRTGRSPYETGLYPFLKWAFDVESVLKPEISSSPAIGADGTVYVGDHNGYLNALNPDGSLKWAFKSQGNTVDSTPAIGPDGTIYVGSTGWLDNSFYALNPDGSIKWEFEPGPHVSSSPVTGEDGTIYVGSLDTFLYALNPDGSVKWEYKTGGGIFSSPAIGADGTIYVGTLDTFLYALNPDGSLKWTFETGNYVKSSPVIGADETVYIVSDDGYLYALNPDGALLWKYNLFPFVPPSSFFSATSSPAVEADGTIYVGSDDGNLYALNPDGSLQWTFFVGGRDMSCPVIGADGTIYIGSDAGYLCAIDPDGSLKWFFETEAFGPSTAIVFPSPAIGADGTIYVGGNQLYAIGTMSHGVQGKVTDLSSGLSIEGAIISVIGNNMKNTHSNQIGDYSLELIPGIYEITVSKDGYQNHTMRGVVVDVNTLTELDFEITTAGPLQITTETLKPGIFGQNIETRIRISGGNSPYQFSIISGALPAGLTLDISSGSIKGAPTAEGSYTFTIGVSDSTNNYQEREFNLNIIPNESPWPMIGHDGSHTGQSLYKTGIYPALRWVHETGGDVYSPVIGADGTVYVGSSDKYLYALNPNGSLKWTYKIRGSVTFSPVIGADGTIYIGDSASYAGDIGSFLKPYLYVLNPDGSLKGLSDVGGSISSSPILGADGTVYVVSRNSVYALNSDGSIQWSFETGGEISSTPAIGAYRTIYVGTDDKYLYALNSDGDLQWRFETGGGIISSTAIGLDETIYAGGNDGYLYALNPDGSLQWAYEIEDEVRSMAIGADETIYAGTNNGYVYALNPDGTLKWAFEMWDEVHSLAIGADETIYAGGNNGYLYALGVDGNFKWACKIGDRINSAVIGADGIIYVGSNNNKLYALGTVLTGIIGKVTDLSNDSPIAGAMISTTKGDESSAQSGPMGGYVLELTPGVHEITVSKDGYQSMTVGDVVINKDIIIPMNLEITAPGPLQIVTDTLWAGIFNQLLNTRIRIAGGIYPYHFSIVSGALPPGLTLDISTGAIQGTPIAEGLYPFTIGVIDSVNHYQEREFSLKIFPNESPWPLRGHDVSRTGQSLYETGSDPYLRWAYETEGDVDSSPAVGADGTMYIGSYDGYLYAFYPDGSFRWSYNTGGRIRSSPALWEDGTVYVGNDHGYLFALNPNGSLKWYYETGDHVRSSPVIGANGAVYFGSDDGHLYALNPDGSLGWAYETGGSIGSSPSIGTNGSIYVGSDDGHLYALDPNGNLTWEYDTGDWVRSSPAIGADGTVYVGNDDWCFYALNPDGSLKWRYETGDYVSSSPAIGKDGSVYVGCDDGHLYAFDPNGNLRWEYDTGDWVRSSPAIGADGAVYVGCDDGHLYALNPDGSLKWRYEIGDYIRSSPAIGADGTLYFGSDDNNIYAIGTLTQFMTRQSIIQVRVDEIGYEEKR